MNAPRLRVELTTEEHVHCFRLVVPARPQPDSEEWVEIEVMLHAAALVELIHNASIAYGAWLAHSSEVIICRMTGLSPDEARARGLLAPEPERSDTSEKLRAIERDHGGAG